jgi:hypothetical protein
VTDVIEVSEQGPPGPPGLASLAGTLTTILAGTSQTLNESGVQRVLVASDGAAATAVFPLVPLDGDAIWVHTSGATVVNQVTLNPNGALIENPMTPGTTTSSNVTMGPNPGASAIFVYEIANTLWRLWA